MLPWLFRNMENICKSVCCSSFFFQHCNCHPFNSFVNGPFRRCRAKLRFLDLWSFRKIRCKLSEIWKPKFANIHKRQPYISLYILANLGSHIYESLQRSFLKLHRLTKFSTINQFMEMNFCFNRKNTRNSNFARHRRKGPLSVFISF